MRNTEVGASLLVQSSGKTVVTSGGASILGVLFCGTATGSVQFYACKTTASTTAATAISPAISFCATTSAVAGGFSPMFMRFPAEVSGNGLVIDAGATADPNLILFWQPNPTTP